MHRRPTLQDIADEAGVSAGLVSVVLRGRPGASAATAARVIEVAERLGYRANRTASQLASRRTRLLGVVMTPDNPYHGELIGLVQAAAHARGYQVLLAAVTPTQNEQRSVETLVDSSCEALVILGPTLEAEELEHAVAGVPTVCIGRPLELPEIDVVRAADIEAMDLLVGHLADLGHRRIAHVDGGDRALPAERRRGYDLAMRVRGLDPLVIGGGDTQESGALAVAHLLRHRDVTAVVAYNDLCALGVMDRLLRHGIRVPRDMSVTGFDDDRLAGLASIDLTTIDPSKQEQARVGVEAALDRADGRRTDRIVHVATCHLIVRGTTGPAPR